MMCSHVWSIWVCHCNLLMDLSGRFLKGNQKDNHPFWGVTWCTSKRPAKWADPGSGAHPAGRRALGRSENRRQRLEFPGRSPPPLGQRAAGRIVSRVNRHETAAAGAGLTWRTLTGNPGKDNFVKLWLGLRNRAKSFLVWGVTTGRIMINPGKGDVLVPTLTNGVVFDEC